MTKILHDGKSSIQERKNIATGSGQGSITSPLGFGVEGLAYPENLTTVQQGHIVIFKIAKVSPRKILNDVKEDNLSVGKTTDTKQELDSKAPVFNKAIGAIDSSATGLSNAINRVLPEGSKKLHQQVMEKTEEVIEGGAQVRDLVDEDLRGPAAVVQNDSVIALYMPGNLTHASNIEWSEADIGSVLGQLSGGGTNLASSGSGLLNRISSAFQNKGGVAAGDLVGTVTGLNTKDFLELKRKAILNPYKEVLFKGIGHRTFQFQFKFTPRNRRETLIVQKIIHKFRLNAHPTYSNLGDNESSNKAFLGYPNEFRIEFRRAGDYKINEFIPKISSCAITNISVNYGPQGIYEGHTDGSPTEIDLSLEFKELEIMTQHKIRQGY